MDEFQILWLNINADLFFGFTDGCSRKGLVPIYMASRKRIVTVSPTSISPSEE